MELSEARRVLSVDANDDWPVVKAAYRRLIADAHPDRAGEGATHRAARLNAAYRELGRANREGRLGAQPSRVPHRPNAASEAPGDATESAARRRRRATARAGDGPPDLGILGADTLVLRTPPAETFQRVLVAVDALGEISYLDRSAALVEAVVTLTDGTPASLVLSLQWRAHDATCEVFATLEALDRAEHLDVSGVVEQLGTLVPPADGCP